MDLEYLLWLQNWREATGNIFTPFMMGWSDFVISWLLFVPVIFYWCVSRRAGLYLLMCGMVSNFINGVMKISFCVYRPWIRDPRIIPAGNAIKTAGGYSFPSGHTMEASPIFGGLTVLYHKKSSLFTLLMTLAIIITAFSRNYLGVHTPQDVVVGTLMALLSVWLVSKVFAWLDKNPGKENTLLIIFVIIAALSIVYAELKSYPMDYANGKLIVDPFPMTRSVYENAGMVLAFAIGCYIEKKFIKFSPTGFEFKKFLVALVGCVPLFFIFFYAHSVAKHHFTNLHWGYFIGGFIRMFYITALWPFVIKKFAN